MRPRVALCFDKQRGRGRTLVEREDECEEARRRFTLVDDADDGGRVLDTVDVRDPTVFNLRRVRRSEDEREPRRAHHSVSPVRLDACLPPGFLREMETKVI